MELDVSNFNIFELIDIYNVYQKKCKKVYAKLDKLTKERNTLDVGRERIYRLIKAMEPFLDEDEKKEFDEEWNNGQK